MISFPMPFYAVPCSIWLAHDGEPDEWGNATVEYSERPDITTSCVYAPGTSRPDTASDIEDGRPHGARVAMTFYLPKTVDADLRGALIACYPPDDPTLNGSKFRIVGQPYSYPRRDTPGDYSWCVEGVEHLG
jgi:hypothetical protein